VITLRPADERHHERRRTHEAWHTFYPKNRADPLADGFGALEALAEHRVWPGAGLPSPARRDTEVITYVHEGGLTCEDSRGGPSVIQAGEFQRRTVGAGSRHKEANLSPRDGARVFRIWVRPSEAGLEASQEQKRFSSAERRGILCLIASPDGRHGSLRIHQDALVHSSLLGPGQHVVHELSPGRGAWLHLLEGEVSVCDVTLGPGDGAGVTEDRAVSITAREITELLLFDLREPLGLGATVRGRPVSQAQPECFEG
jgi:redox-sensitive bicupin YhaK (pirin superfamily)